MKKLRILILAIMALTVTASYAQFNAGGGKSGSSDVTVKYQGDVNVGVMTGNGTLLTIGTTQGVKVTPYFFGGISLNFEGNTSAFDYWNIAPMVSLRGYYPFNDDFRLFLNPELGASIGISGDYNSGSAFEYRITTGIEYKKLQVGLGCGGAGTTLFLAKVGWVF